MGFIYVRTNTVNGKQYVGQTLDTERRNRDWNNLNWKYGGELIEKARVKYTPAAFDFDILKECPDEDMDKWEAYFIDLLNTKIPNGYNLTDGGKGNQGYTWSDDAKKKQSQKYQGRKLSDEWKQHIGDGQRGEKHWNFGGHLSDEHKEKISRAHMGKPLSKEHKANISKTLKNKNGKPVFARNPETLEIVYEFPSTQEAKRNGFNQSCISDCCKGKQKTHMGLIWEYQ